MLFKKNFKFNALKSVSTDILSAPLKPKVFGLKYQKRKIVLALKNAVI